MLYMNWGKEMFLNESCCDLYGICPVFSQLRHQLSKLLVVEGYFCDQFIYTYHYIHICIFVNIFY